MSSRISTAYFRMVCDYLYSYVLYILEVLLNSRAVLMDVMIEGGLVPFLGELLVDETDTIVLVWFSFCLFITIFVDLLNLVLFGVVTIHSFFLFFLSACLFFICMYIYIYIL